MGVEVIEIVTGFVQSNILHHGLYAPEDSVYLPIKGIIEDIKYQGNANGMPAHVYAASITDKLLRRQVDPEIWEGKMARLLRLVFMLLPLRLLVGHLSKSYRDKQLIVPSESPPVPPIQAGLVEGINRSSVTRSGL